MPSRVLIICYGNRLRADDAFGWRVAERLLARNLAPGAEVLAMHQLVPELMDTLSEAELAVFVDAAANAEPGALTERVVEPRPPSRASFTHHSTPEGLLAGALSLFGHAPRAFMVSVAGADFSCSEDLSPLVESRIDDAIQIILRLIA